MIVQCDKCKTEYNLNDDKVKPGETKVRCSRCQNVFTIPNPLTLNEEEIFGEIADKVDDAFLKQWAKEFPAQPPQKPRQPVPPAPDKGPQPRPFIPPAAEETLFVKELPPAVAPISEEEAQPFTIRPLAEAPARKGRKKVSTAFLLGIFLLATVAGALYYWSKMGHSVPAFEYIYEKIYVFMEGKKEQTLFLLYLKGSENTLEGGKIFLIQGKVANRSQETKKIVKLKGFLYDKTGKVVATSSGFCGITITDEEVKNSTYDALKASFGFIAVGQAKPVAVQESSPFTIIFFSPPEGASQYQVEIDEAAESD
ncbi:MAG: zinc-ribbon domain-containing protein [Desulfobacterales bacterium]|nr:zinc-ribbon domain-containing protein [Desulfobacterales bacterium]